MIFYQSVLVWCCFASGASRWHQGASVITDQQDIRPENKNKQNPLGSSWVSFLGPALLFHGTSPVNTAQGLWLAGFWRFFT
jgi:hypothetical protein